jgi:hypothetical protein
MISAGLGRGLLSHTSQQQPQDPLVPVCCQNCLLCRDDGSITIFHPICFKINKKNSTWVEEGGMGGKASTVDSSQIGHSPDPGKPAALNQCPIRTVTAKNPSL